MVDVGEMDGGLCDGDCWMVDVRMWDGVWWKSDG